MARKSTYAQNKESWGTGPHKPIKEPEGQKPTASKPAPLADKPKKNFVLKTAVQSQELVSSFRGEGIELKSPKAIKAYEDLMDTVDFDLSDLATVEERRPGDLEKILIFLQNLALGARHRDALSDVGWVYSNFSIYRSKFPVVSHLYKKVKRMGDEMREIYRLEEMERRAVEGVKEPIYSASGKFCGHKIKYSDTLLALMVKADHPDRFSDRVKVENSGVVLNVNLGLRQNDNVRKDQVIRELKEHDIIPSGNGEEKEDE